MLKIDYKSLHEGRGTMASSDQNDLGGDEHGDERARHQDKYAPLGASGGFGGSPHSLGNPDDDLAIMKEEMRQLQEEERNLMKRAEVDTMRRRLEEQRKKVKQLRGRDDICTGLRDLASEREKSDLRSRSGPGENISQCGSDIDSENITLDTLRKDKKLRNRVKKELKKCGIVSNSSSDSESSDESYFDSSDSKSDQSSKKKKKQKKHKKKKSGINAKASDRVKNPQKWPHSHLQFEHVNKQVKFDELNFQLFVAGELEIISEKDLSSTEKSGRIALLKKLVYYYASYEFKGLKAFYAAWLREIELGKKTWSDDSSHIENAILSKYLLKGTTKSKSTPASKSLSGQSSHDDERVWFCPLYQRNKCLKRSNHVDTFKNKGLKLLQHICATCWIKDKKKLEHPECSSSCPHIAQ